MHQVRQATRTVDHNDKEDSWGEGTEDNEEDVPRGGRVTRTLASDNDEDMLWQEQTGTNDNNEEDMLTQMGGKDY